MPVVVEGVVVVVDGWEVGLRWEDERGGGERTADEAGGSPLSFEAVEPIFPLPLLSLSLSLSILSARSWRECAMNRRMGWGGQALFSCREQ